MWITYSQQIKKRSKNTLSASLLTSDRGSLVREGYASGAGVVARLSAGEIGLKQGEIRGLCAVKCRVPSLWQPEG